MKTQLLMFAVAMFAVVCQAQASAVRSGEVPMPKDDPAMNRAANARLVAEQGPSSCPLDKAPTGNITDASKQEVPLEQAKAKTADRAGKLVK